MNTSDDVKTQFHFEGKKKQVNYGFPHLVKYVAWFIVVAVIISSSAALITYGTRFGTVEIYLWITTFLSFFFLSLFSLPPFRFFILAAIDWIFFQRKSTLIKRRVLPSLFSNPPNSVIKERLQKYRHYNANLYSPMPFYKRQSRLEDIKYNLELQNLTVDIIVYLIFISVTLCTVYSNKPSMGFYNNELILDMLLKKTHEDSVAFKEINTYDKLLKYINGTLLPVLLPNSTDEVPMKNPDETYRKRRRTSSERFLKDSNILSADLQEGENNFDRGWTLNRHIKLMGIPRLRQIRVKTEICKELMKLKSRNIECAPELSFSNEETGDFSLYWGPAPPKGLTEAQSSPWTYQSAWESTSIPIMAKFSFYSAGGYILELARNIEDSRIILQFLDTFQWVDARTRVIFIEFTVYCADTNLFTVITLIAEKSATGYIIPSYQIDTSKLLFPLEIMFIIMSVLHALFLLFFLFKEVLIIYRTSFKKYLNRALGTLDLAVIFFGVLCLIFVVLRNVYVSNLLEELEKADNNKFISFLYASLWYSWSLYLEALLVCLIFIKLFRLLTLRVVFFQLQTILSFCCRHFLHLCAKHLILITSFVFLFGLTFMNYFESFRDFRTSFYTVTGRAVTLDDYCQITTICCSFWYLGPLFFNSFIFLVLVLLVNGFTAVTCLFFQKIRNTQLAEKYNISEYVKYLLTIRRQKGLFHKNEEKMFPRNADNRDVMRLTGGGNKPGKCEKKAKMKTKMKCKKVRKKKGKNPGSENKCEQTPTTLENFLVKKPYDVTAYWNLTESREMALKNLMTWFLGDDENVRKVAKENALKALFLSFVTETGSNQPGNSEKYFFVKETGVNTKVCHKGTLLKIRKAMENIGKEKDWLVEEDDWEEEDFGRENNLAILKRKLCLLINNFKKR